jgi:hypothetical protein
MHRRALWKAADELIKKLLGADLEMKSVPAVLDANVEELSNGELRAGEGGQRIVH